MQTLNVYSELVSRVAKLRKDASELKSDALCGLLAAPPDDDDDGGEYGESKGGRSENGIGTSDELNARLEREQRQQVARATAQRLESAERERLALLEFLQGDMGNTAVLARRLELLEADLSAAKDAQALATQRAKESEAAATQSRLEVERQDAQITALQRSVDQLSVDKDLQQRERAQLEQIVPQLREEAAQLRTQLRAANEQLGVAQPRLQQVEPELLRLRKACSEWQLERSQLVDELDRLKPLVQILGDVETEFTSKAFVSADEVPPVSAWSAGPQLRRLCPRLYDYLRFAAQSGYRKEAEAVDAAEARDRTQRELDALRAEAGETESALRVALDQARASLDDCAYRLRLYEEELPAGRRALQVLAQVRGSLASFPGGVRGLFTAVGFDPVAEAAVGGAVGGAGGGRAGAGGGGLADRDERVYGYSQGFDQRLLLKKSGGGGGGGARGAAQAAAVESGRGPKSSSSSGANTANAAPSPAPSPDQVPDELLAALLGKALAHNFNSVVALRDTRQQLEQREAALDRLKQELHSTTRRSEARREALEELQGSLSGLQNTRTLQEDKLRASLESAAELVENQNMFAVLLEAKLEDSKRTVVALTKQLEAAQQAEALTKGRLWAALKQGGHCPPNHDSSRLSDLLDIAVSLLAVPEAEAGAQAQAQAQVQGGAAATEAAAAAGAGGGGGGGGGLAAATAAAAATGAGSAADSIFLRPQASFSEMRSQLSRKLARAEAEAAAESDSDLAGLASSSRSQRGAASVYGETSRFFTSPDRERSALGLGLGLGMGLGLGQTGRSDRGSSVRGGASFTPFSPAPPLPPPSVINSAAAAALAGTNPSSAFQDRLREASLSLQALREN